MGKRRAKNQKGSAELHAEQFQNVCLYTILNAPNGVCSAAFSENLETLAIGYGNSTIQLHALGAKAFRQLRSAEELEALDSEYDEISEAMYDESTKAEKIELTVSVLCSSLAVVFIGSFGRCTFCLLLL